MIFFDKDELLSGIFQDSDSKIEGRAAIDRVIESSMAHNFTVNIYKIDPEQVYFWTTLPSAKEIYRDLGVRMLQLTYNDAESFGIGADDSD